MPTELGTNPSLEALHPPNCSQIHSWSLCPVLSWRCRWIPFFPLCAPPSHLHLKVQLDLRPWWDCSLHRHSPPPPLRATSPSLAPDSSAIFDRSSRTCPCRLPIRLPLQLGPHHRFLPLRSPHSLHRPNHHWTTIEVACERSTRFRRRTS
ncbi:hypothetical protein M427DRAFT_171563 [Gonapodya prolifera JEL478]|uniref:Uncharacterized protein n=1 Tax=Gonapodya prolifera (strain JEL478) TaxID=1344416 RepID=A0A139B108_GONPJ|nr:hypothetical protein M427DRAFT_171563 [Gonapodya prolifera JEL478]|eukprot:KXS22385.1 hypothetical protein M427DRAFT_171563 [Gonapodya prolifera JEL478]